MSQLYDIRAAIKAAIIAEPTLDWTDTTIIILRQGSFWNSVATAINSAKNGAVLHIGVAAGKRSDDESLEYDLEIPVTIICKPQVSPSAVPEEDLWEALVTFLDDLRVDGVHHRYRLVAGDFTDLDIAIDGGSNYLGRQTLFRRKLAL